MFLNVDSQSIRHHSHTSRPGKNSFSEGSSFCLRNRMLLNVRDPSPWCKFFSRLISWKAVLQPPALHSPYSTMSVFVQLTYLCMFFCVTVLPLPSLRSTTHCGYATGAPALAWRWFFRKPLGNRRETGSWLSLWHHKPSSESEYTSRRGYCEHSSLSFWKCCHIHAGSSIWGTSWSCWRCWAGKWWSDLSVPFIRRSL